MINRYSNVSSNRISVTVNNVEPTITEINGYARLQREISDIVRAIATNFRDDNLIYFCFL